MHFSIDPIADVIKFVLLRKKINVKITEERLNSRIDENFFSVITNFFPNIFEYKISSRGHVLISHLILYFHLLCI